MKRYSMSFGQSLSFKLPHPERTAKRSGSGHDVTFQEWTNRKAMAKSIRMQEQGPSHYLNWKAVVPLTDGEGY